VFEFLFKYPREVFAHGEWVLARAADAHWLAGLVLVALLLLAVSAARGARARGLPAWQRLMLGGLQLGALGLVAALLLDPALVVERLRPGANSVAILIDGSESMNLPADGRRSRAEAARVVASELTDALAGRVQVTAFEFDRAARRLEAPDESAPRGAETRLVRSVEDVLAAFGGVPLAAVVVVTDGADTSGTPSLAAVAAGGVPVHAVGLGSPVLVDETLIEDVQVPVEVPVRSAVNAIVSLRHQGSGRALLRVLENGRVVAVESVELPATQELVRTTVSFDSGRAGIRDLSFEVVPDGPDTLAANNRLERLLTVSERKRAVLYLEGEPRWEYKFLRRALAGDDVVVLSSYLKTTDRKSYRQGVASADGLISGLPVDPAELFAFDVVVLGSLPAADLSAPQLELLESFVSRRGGSLLVLAGRHSQAAGGWQSTPLARLLPVAMGPPDGYSQRRGRAVVTRAGALSPITALPSGEGGDPWDTLPELGDLQTSGALKPAATVLLAFQPEAGGPTEPLLVVQPFGLGTVALMATSTTWRWQTRTPEGDVRHQRFWRQLTRQLAGQAQQPREITVAGRGDELELKAVLRSPAYEPLSPARVTARITAPDGTETEVVLAPARAPGEFTATLPGRAPGVHKVDVPLDDATVITRFVRLGQRDPEQRSPVQNVALLRRLADATGGRYWTSDTADGIPAALTYTGGGIRERQIEPLWDMPALLLLLLGLKVAEWLLRRRWRRI